MHRRDVIAMGAAAAALAAAGQGRAKEPPANWDGLTRIPSKKLKYVYVLPGADFRKFDKVMLDPVEIAFKENWMRDYNASHLRGTGGRLNDSDVRRAVEEGGKVASEIFAKAFADGGYPVVTAPGEGVLRVRAGIMNLSVTAPDTNRSARSRTYAAEAGSATLVIEVGDSMTGALLGRAADARVAGDTSIMMNRNSVLNRADFRDLVKTWANAAVRGLGELKARGPA